MSIGAKPFASIKLLALVSPLAFTACVSPKMAVGISPSHPMTSQNAKMATDKNGRPIRADGSPGQGKVDFLQPPQRIAAPNTSLTKTPEATNAQIAALLDESPVEATLPPQSVPQFVDTVLGTLIGTPYILGPGVAEMRDIVSLRGSIRTSKRSLFSMVQLALKDYGVTLAIENGTVRVIRDQTANSGAPSFVSGRALPETPAASRPVIQFFELKSIDVNSLIELLKDAYPNSDRVKFAPRQDINTLVISGTARDVAAAAQVIDNIDQPRFSGASVARINPTYWAADKLVEAVSQVLTTEGYQTGRGGSSIQRAVTFLPVPYTNQILLFSNLPDAFDRALYWIGEFDKATAFGDQENIFVYTVENTSADELGRLVSNVQLGPGGPTGAPAAPGGRPVDPGTQSGQAQAAQPYSLGRVTIDPAGNRLLFRGTPSEFQRWRDIVQQLDTPPQQVLIEMTIAEVTLTDETRFGVEWFLRDALGKGTISGGTLGGLGIGGDALTFDFTKTNLNVVLNAFASNNNINILSTPRVVARSGGQATFQVGTDVPIITSQRAANTQANGSTDVLQTVQYRQTGVLLSMQPTVYGGDRIDLKISQEVSSQQNNSNTAIASPLILNRSVDTQISLREGATAVIGGLIQDNYTRGTTGVPLLKDVPFLGGAFRTDTLSNNKTELLILVTPYIIRSGDELVTAAESYATTLNQTLGRRGPHAYTLLPWGIGPRPEVVHGGVPTLRSPQAPPRAPELTPGGGPSPEAEAAPAISTAPAAQLPQREAAASPAPVQTAAITLAPAPEAGIKPLQPPAPQPVATVAPIQPAPEKTPAAAPAVER